LLLDFLPSLRLFMFDDPVEVIQHVGV